MKLGDNVNSILAPTDLSELADHGVVTAARLAAENGAALHVLHVIDYKEVLPAPPTPTDLETSHPQRTYSTEGIDRVLEETRQQVHSHVDALVTRLDRELRLRVLVEIGTPPDVIVACARDQDSDLVVMCTHGRTGLARMLIGSVAEQVVRRAPCPVLTLHPPE